MKNTFLILWSMLLNTFLLTLSILLTILFLIPGILTTVFVFFFKKQVGNGFYNLSNYFRNLAISIDQFGNVLCGTLFDLILIKKGGYRFGNPDETISSVIGKNQVKRTLTIVGKILNKILNILDTNHSIVAIEKDETNGLKGPIGGGDIVKPKQGND